MNELLLAAVAFLAGFATAWTLRAALARADRIPAGPGGKVPWHSHNPGIVLKIPDEIVDLEWIDSPWTNGQRFYRDMAEKEYFKARRGRANMPTPMDPPNAIAARARK